MPIRTCRDSVDAPGAPTAAARRTLIAVAAWLWLGALGFAAPAWAVEHIVERAFVEDPTGSWTWDEARAHSLTPFTGVLGQGFGAGTLWVRLRIDPARSGAAPGTTLFLRMRPVFLDELVLYDPLQSPLPHAPVGDRYPLSAQDEPSTSFVLTLPAGAAPRDVWVRLRTTSTRLAQFEVLDEASLRATELRITLLGAMYISLIGLFILWGLANSVSRGDRLNRTFTAVQVISLMHGVVHLGYVRLFAPDWLGPMALDRLFSALTVLYAFGAATFVLLLIDEMAPRRRRKTLLAGIAAGLVLIGLVLAGEVRLAMTLNNAVILLLPPVLLVLAAASTPSTGLLPSGEVAFPKRAVMVYLAVLVLVTSVAAVPNLGLRRPSELSLYLMIVYSFPTGLLMLAMLQYRAQFTARQRALLKIEAEQAHQRAEVEHAQRVEREQMLDMLAHELKTPLATLRMRLGDRQIPAEISARLTDPIAEIREVIERTVQTGQVESGGIRLHWQTCDVVALVRDWLRALPGSERVVFDADGDDGRPAPVRTDPYFLGVVVRNLLDNGLKYSPDGSPVTLALARPDASGAWSMTVTNLVGRAGRPDPEQVFRKYWRSPAAMYRSGSGQGLYLVFRLAALLGGRLTCEPDAGPVRFTLTMGPHPDAAEQP